MDSKPRPPGKGATQAEIDAYAQSLLKMVNMDYQKQQAEKPQVHHLLSKKRIIILVVTTVLSIILFWAASNALGTKTQNPSQTLDSLRSAGNPNDY